MIQSFRGRSIEDGQLVKVYFHFRKKLFSVKDVKTGLVLCHADSITLNDVTFEVNEKDRQRVLSTGVKNVHAYVVGNIDLQCNEALNDNRVWYDPFKTDCFKLNEERIDKCKRAYMSEKKVYVELQKSFDK